MNLVYQEIKEEMKTLAKSIREKKDERNNLFRESHQIIINDEPNQEMISKACVIQYKDLPILKHEFRHRHIARCELRGKTREQIETPSENHPANEKYITKIKEEWTKRYEEALCANAA